MRSEPDFISELRFRINTLEERVVRGGKLSQNDNLMLKAWKDIVDISIPVVSVESDVSDEENESGDDEFGERGSDYVMATLNISGSTTENVTSSKSARNEKDANISISSNSSDDDDEKCNLRLVGESIAAKAVTSSVSRRFRASSHDGIAINSTSVNLATSIYTCSHVAVGAVSSSTAGDNSCSSQKSFGSMQEQRARGRSADPSPYRGTCEAQLFSPEQTLPPSVSSSRSISTKKELAASDSALRGVSKKLEPVGVDSVSSCRSISMKKELAASDSALRGVSKKLEPVGVDSVSSCRSISMKKELAASDSALRGVSKKLESVGVDSISSCRSFSQKKELKASDFVSATVLQKSEPVGLNSASSISRSISKKTNESKELPLTADLSPIGLNHATIRSTRKSRMTSPSLKSTGTPILGKADLSTKKTPNDAGKTYAE